MAKTSKDYEDGYPRDVVFRVKTHQDHMDLFGLLYKHGIEYEEVLQERDTFVLDFTNWCD